MAQVRMYVQKGCPHCEAAKTFLEAQKVTIETIEIGFDPVLQAGIRNLSSGQGLPVPIVISYATQELIVGNDIAQLQRIVDSLIPSAVPPNPAAQ